MQCANLKFSCEEVLSFMRLQHPCSFREDTPPLPQWRLRGGRRGSVANGGRCAPPAGPGEVEPCAMAASRLPPSALTLRQVRACGSGLSSPACSRHGGAEPRREQGGGFGCRGRAVLAGSPRRRRRGVGALRFRSGRCGPEGVL